MNFRDDTLGWAKQCDRLYVWDYVTNFSHFWMPHPNFHVLAENIRFLYENNARGFFEQGSGPKCVCGGEMNDLRAYIIGKAMWDPYCDAKKMQTEFLAAAYGASAGCMEEYLDTVYQAVLEAGCHLYCFNHPDKPWHTMKLVERCEDIFAEAKKLAADEEILDRIKLQELAVRYLRILLTPKGSAERNALLDTFAADAKAYGITQLSERLQIDENIAVLRGEADPGYWWAK